MPATEATEKRLMGAAYRDTNVEAIEIELGNCLVCGQLLSNPKKIIRYATQMPYGEEEREANLQNILTVIGLEHSKTTCIAKPGDIPILVIRATRKGIEIPLTPDDLSHLAEKAGANLAQVSRN